MDLLLKGGTLLDGTESPPQPNTSVLVADGAIRAIGLAAERTATPGGQVIDVTGLTVLPGLINVHDHLTYKRVPGPPLQHMARPASRLGIQAAKSVLASLRAGITTLREMGSPARINFEIQQAVECGELPGPRILATTPLTTPRGHAHWICREVTTEQEVEEALDDLLARGMDFVKLMASHDPVPRNHAGQHTVQQYSRRHLQRAVAMAHEAGKRITVHCMGTEALRDAIESGMDCIEHAIYLDRETARSMAERDIFLVPTLDAYSHQSVDPAWRRGAGWEEEHRPLAEAQRISFAFAVEAGIRMAVGTDSLGDFVDEMRYMIAGGLSTAQVLRAATSGGAELLGLEDRLGAVRPGYEADLAVVDGSPLDDVETLRNIVYVCKGGRLYRPADLDALALQLA